MASIYYSSGIGFTGGLQLLFIALKLLGKISWSWFWVLSPIWISISFIILLITIALIVAVVSS